MFKSIGVDTERLDDQWQRRCTDHFAQRLRDVNEFTAFVIDKPDGGLAACAVGWLTPHLIGVRNLTGQTGYLANVCTEPTYRRRGYGRATVTAVLDWLRSAGATSVDLHATGDGEPLYRSLGFTEPWGRALTLRF